MALEADIRDYLADVARRIDAAAHGQTEPIVSEVTGFLGWSRATLYKRLRRDVGWHSGRKARADKGTTCVPVERIEMLAAMKREAVRKNGKRTLFTSTGASIMVANDLDLPVSNGQLNKLMKARKLDLDTQAKADAPGRLKSLHPNHVHQVDPSLCVLYYMRGQQHIMEADAFYKNKLDNYAKVKLKVWRYVLYDHASAVLAVRYYEAAGENPVILFDFLMWAWGQQPGREFHGVPKILVWDKGSANTAAAIKNLLLSLEVTAIEHAAGKARVKGGVENGNNLVETKFESRLKFEPVESVEQLNAAVLHWQNAFNADLIVRDDCRLRRRGMEPTARYNLWRRISSAQLRILPGLEICRALLSGKELERPVSRELTISFKHPAAPRTRYYKVDGLDGICAGDKVMVRPLLIGGDCSLHLRMTRYDGEDVFHRLEAEPAPDEYGFEADAPVWNETYKATADTAADKAAKRMDAMAFPDQDATKARAKQVAPFGGLNAHSHLADIYQPTALPKRGTALNVPDRAHVEIKRMTHAETAALLTRLLPDWGRDDMRALKVGWPDGVLPDDVGTVAEALRQARELTQERPKLALVS